jgi:hypothetical protein
MESNRHLLENAAQQPPSGARARRARDTPGAPSLRPIRECRCVTSAQFDEEIACGHEPVVMRELVSHWPAVRAARDSAGALKTYLSHLDNKTKVRAFVGSAETRGRMFYSAGFDGFNFQQVDGELRQLLSAIEQGTGSRHIYMGSTPTAQLLPRFANENPLGLAEGKPTEPRIWIGSDSVVAPHFDESDNIACVVSGRRRFTLFPPDQVANLYVGPIDKTMAGQPASLVEIDNPDLERFPRFPEALKHGLEADLEPGDAIYIPALWWHAVRATGALNVLINYWWQDTPLDAGSPMVAIAAALLSIALLPEEKRLGWRSMFDHFVFRLNGDPAAHIPQHAQGVLGPSTPGLRHALRAFLIRALNGNRSSGN